MCNEIKTANRPPTAKPVLVRLIPTLIVATLLVVLTVQLWFASRAQQEAALKAALTSPSVPAYNAPVLVVAGRKPTLPDIDPASIVPSNNGYSIDLDGDGVPDYVIMDDNGDVHWTKGPVNQHYPIVVVKVKGDLRAYTFNVLPGDSKFSLLFWTVDNKGYHQKCLGVTGAGVPYFGEVEGL